MDWKEIVTALVTAVTALGGWEAIKYLINRKSNARMAKAEAERAGLAAKTDDFNVLRETNLFLQQQLHDKEERFAEQTQIVRDQQKEILRLTKEAGELAIREQRYHCEVPHCANRQPPNGY